MVSLSWSPKSHRQQWPTTMLLLLLLPLLLLMPMNLLSSTTAFVVPTASSRGLQERVRVRVSLQATVQHRQEQQQEPPSDNSNSNLKKGGDNGIVGDEEWHPVNPASTTPQFLAGLWELIARGNDMVRGDTFTVLFPNMEKTFASSPRYLNLVTAHLDACKDVCDHFGITTTLVPHVQGNRIRGFTVKSYRDPNKDPDAMEFEYDPFWDDGDEDNDWNYDGIDDEFDEKAAQTSANKYNRYPEIVDKVPADDTIIIETTKRWVSKLMSDMGICPFTNGPERAGLPMGPVRYAVDRSASMEFMYEAYWKEVMRVETQTERELSTTLLIAPEFCMDNVELFENFSTTLTQPLAALGVEDLLQLVFFHPHWSFRDGSERTEGAAAGAANYARRSPWPMINILRTNQVRAAQKGIPTGLVYKQNEKTLGEIGVDRLETMLRLRDWQDIADLKVNRRDMEALRVAQDIQTSGGIVSARDADFLHDATPAANKVDERQIQNSNLCNVIREAIGKRLEHGGTRLSGPETSAAIMASDFLLEELDKVSRSAAASASATARPATATTTDAHRAILEDFDPETLDEQEEDRMGSVLFGRSGLMDGPVTVGGYYSTGNDPNNFY